MSRILVLHNQDRQFFDFLSRQPVSDPNSDDCYYFPDNFDYEIFLFLKSIKHFTPRYLISDIGDYHEQDARRYRTIFIPDLRYGMQQIVRNLVKENVPMVKSCTTEKNFNFSVNVRRLDRIVMMKLVSWLGLESYNYTWRGQGVDFDMTPVTRDMKKINYSWLTKEFRNYMLAPLIGFKPKWTEINPIPKTYEHGIAPFASIDNINYGWINAIKPVMEHTAVTLICESSSQPELKFFQLAEKTLLSIMAATFPIWVGNYKQADTLEEIGFDVFSDVIDHSYQYRDTLLERCYHALVDNIEILTDLGLAAELRTRHWDRLMANQNRLLQQNLLGKYAITQARKLPTEIQERLLFLNDGCRIPTGPTRA